MWAAISFRPRSDSHSEEDNDMIQPIRFLIFAGAAFVAPVFLGNCAKADAPASRPVASPTQTPASRTQSASTDSPAIVLADAEKQAVAEFETRVADHATL